MSAFMVPVCNYLTEEEAQEYTGEADAAPGYYARLSAPGYLDATDWMGPYWSMQAALVELCDFYEVDTDGNLFGDEDYDDTELEEIRAVAAATKSE